MNELTKTEIKEIKIEQNNIDELSNDLSNQFEIIEDSFIAQKNVALSKYSLNTDFKTWKENQKIVRTQLKKDFEKSIKETTKVVNKSIDNTFNSLNKAIIGLGDFKTSKVGRVNIEAVAEKGIKLFANKVMSEYDKSVAKVYKLRNQEPLFDAILKQTQEGIDKAPYKIAYRNGRQVSFKSYMEMNVRTTTRQEANNYLFKASKKNGVVFYICNSFGDCADDHRDFQGKYYFDKDWKSFGYDEETSKRIQKTIDSYGMRSYQDVVNNRPYLTTRPNCRHSLRPVVLDDVFDNTPKQMTEKYKIKKGTYKDGNYQALQRQRAIERNLRFYKTRLEEHSLMKKENPNPKINELIKNDVALIKKWNAEMQNLLDNNSFLYRDKRRENNKILVQDAGAGYSLGLKIDGKNMYVKGTTQKPITPKEIESGVKVEEIKRIGQLQLTEAMNEYDYYSQENEKNRFEKIQKLSNFDDLKTQKTLEAFCGSSVDFINNANAGKYDYKEGWFYGEDYDIRNKITKEAENKAYIINDYIEASPKFEGTIYRGLSLEQETINNFKEGNVFVDNGLLSSWTSDKNVANMFAEERSKELNKKPVILQMENPSYGTPVAHLSIFGIEESEVIVSNIKNNKYLITEVSNKESFVLIKLKEGE